jgi:hypothetical protein
MTLELEALVRWFILHPYKVSPSTRFEKIARFIEENYPEVLEYTRDCRCPFCGKRFANRASLAMHLSGGKCGSRFKSLLIEVVERVREL